MHKASAHLKKWKNVNLSDLAAINEGKRRIRLPLTVGLGVLGGITSKPIADTYINKAEEELNSRKGNDYKIPDVSEKGIYQGQAYKVPLDDLDAMKQLYKEIMKEEWNPKAPKWAETITGDEQHRMALYIRNKLSDDPEARKGLKTGEVASLVYPFAYDVAADKVKRFHRPPFKNGVFNYRGLMAKDFKKVKKLDKNASGVLGMIVPRIAGLAAGAGTAGISYYLSGLLDKNSKHIVARSIGSAILGAVAGVSTAVGTGMWMNSK